MPGSTVTGWPPCWPTRYPDAVPLETLITGRIATLAGETGFGWVEAIGIRDGRVAFAGSEVDLETRADPFTERIVLEPDEVAIPGLTDAHLHLARTAVSIRQVDLTDAATLAEGLARIQARHEALADPAAWLEGHGWDVDRWGRWPTADDLESVAPGRRVALWAHDHHSLLASRAALAISGLGRDTADPAGGVIRRGPDGEPEGVLQEAATRLVTVHTPPMAQADLEAAIVAVSLDLLALGVVAAHDPGGLAPDPDLGWSYPAYAHLSEIGRLPMRVLASFRDDALETALAGGLRSGAVLGADPEGRARIGWQKCFADGSLGSRTAALLADIEWEPDRAIPPGLRRGVWNTEPGRLRELVERAAAGGIATQIHAIGDAAVRAALDALEPSASRVPFMPKVEHVQLLDPADRGRFAKAGIAASVQPAHLGTDAAQARALWGSRAERAGYPWGSIAATGAVLAFGTDAPVEPFDPWPGIALAVRREDPRWPKGTPPFGPSEALSLDRAIRAACVDPVRSARESDRGRLTVGQRADVVVIPAAAVDRPRRARRRARHGPAVDRRGRRARRLRGGGGRGGGGREVLGPAALGPNAIQFAPRIGEQPVEDARRGWEGVDGLGEDVDGDAGLDGEDALVDGRRRIGTRDRGPDELARCPIYHDRHVPELGFEGVAARALREVGDQLEGVEPCLPRALERHPDRRRLRLGIGRPRQRPVIGRDRLAERHPDGDLPLVMGLVRVQLGPAASPTTHRPSATRRRPSRGNGVRPVVSMP